MGAAFGEDVLAGDVGFALEEREEIMAGHLCAGSEADGGEERGGQIFAAEQRAGIAAGPHDAGPADHERDVATGIVEGAFAVGERGAVVAGEDDEGVAGKAARGEQVEDGLHAAVDAVHFAAIVGELLAQAGQIGPVGGELERGRIGAVGGRGRPRVVGIAEIEPEAERLVLGLLIEELTHLLDRLRVGTGAEVVDAFLESPQAVLRDEAGVGRAAVGAGSVEVIRAPADAGVVAGFFAEDFREGNFVARQRRRETRHAGGDGGAAREKAGAGRHALGRDGEQAVEFHALGRELIEGGRADVGVPVAAEERIAVVVGEDEEDVGFRGNGGGEHAGNEGEQQGEDGGAKAHGEEGETVVR